VDQYEELELTRLWTLIRKLDAALMDNIHCFAKRAMHRNIPAHQMERGIYEKCLMRFLTAIASVHEGLFPLATVPLFEASCENYTQVHAGELHTRFVRPVLIDVFKRLRKTAEKAGSRETKAIAAIRVGSPKILSIHDRAAVENEETKLLPTPVPTYFEYGHASKPYFSGAAFTWYKKHVIPDRTAGGDYEVIPDSDSDDATQDPGSGKKKRQKKRKKHEALDQKKHDPKLGVLIDTTDGGNDRSRDAWRTSMSKVSAMTFKKAFTQWFMATAKCQRTEVQCPYFVFTDYAMCPSSLPCMKQPPNGYVHLADVKSITQSQVDTAISTRTRLLVYFHHCIRN
jgi:hypothetical protein